MTKKQKQLEYETKSDFQFDDGSRGEYTIWEDRIETTCRRCKTQHQVSDKYAEKARTNNTLLENALCLNCYLEEKEIEKGLEKDEKRGYNPNAPRIGQAINLVILSGGKSPKDFGTKDEIKEKVVEWLELTDEIQEENG